MPVDGGSAGTGAYLPSVPTDGGAAGTAFADDLDGGASAPQPVGTADGGGA